MQQKIQHVVDLTSLSVVVGTLMELLPPIAALLSILWLGINIYERVTGNKLVEMYKKWRAKRNTKK